MFETLQTDTELFQEEAVEEIESKFGTEFVYENENGNFAINRQVLKESRKLTKKTSSGNETSDTGASEKLTTIRINDKPNIKRNSFCKILRVIKHLKLK